MKKILVCLIVLLAIGCSSINFNKANVIPASNCLGNTEIPQAYSDQFMEVEDESLLKSALGSPNEGKLCWGKVYVSKQGSNVMIYRAWNSTNPNSQMGQWWVFEEPTGLISNYRNNYEICHQWSPLDKLVSAKLKPGAKIVVGTGQSAKCSEYLTYPTSASKQIFIENASNSVEILNEYELIFNWQ